MYTARGREGSRGQSARPTPGRGQRRSLCGRIACCIVLTFKSITAPSCQRCINPAARPQSDWSMASQLDAPTANIVPRRVELGAGGIERTPQLLHERVSVQHLASHHRERRRALAGVDELHIRDPLR